MPKTLIKDRYLSLVYLFLIITYPPLTEETLNGFPILLPTITFSQSLFTIEQKLLSYAAGIRSHKISSLTKTILCFLHIQITLSIQYLVHMRPERLFGLTKMRTFANLAFFSNYSKSIQYLVSKPFLQSWSQTSIGILPRTRMMLQQGMQQGVKTKIPSPFYEKQLTTTFDIVNTEQEVRISSSLRSFCGSFRNLVPYHCFIELKYSSEGCLYVRLFIFSIFQRNLFRNGWQIGRSISATFNIYYVLCYFHFLEFTSRIKFGILKQQYIAACKYLNKGKISIQVYQLILLFKSEITVIQLKKQP